MVRDAGEGGRSRPGMADDATSVWDTRNARVGGGQARRGLGMAGAILQSYSGIFASLLFSSNNDARYALSRFVSLGCFAEPFARLGVERRVKGNRERKVSQRNVAKCERQGERIKRT